jgi:hypothetical protein
MKRKVFYSSELETGCQKKIAKPMETTPKIGKDDVIAKVKDDGDFDRLRLKIIRKVKDNVSLFLFFTLSFLLFPLSPRVSNFDFCKQVCRF